MVELAQEQALRPFEQTLLENLISGYPQRGKSVSRTGVWIKGHLQDVNEDYLYGMWQKYMYFIGVVNAYSPKALKRSEKPFARLIYDQAYLHFKTYFWLLEQEELVQFVREEPSDKGSYFPKHYYKLNPRKLRSRYWLNPWSRYRSWREWQGRKFGRVATGRPRGRPSKIIEKSGILDELSGKPAKWVVPPVELPPAKPPEITPIPGVVEFAAAFDRTYTRAFVSMPDAPLTHDIGLRGVASELGMDFKSPEFAARVEEMVKEGTFRFAPTIEAKNNIQIRMPGLLHKQSIGLVRRRKRE